MNLMKMTTTLVFSSALVAFVACGEKKTSHEFHARVSTLSGSVQVNGKPARAGAILNWGDLIETGPDGEADLLLQNRGGLTIRANTVLTLNMDDDKLGLNLDHGDLVAAFHKIPANRNVAVVTPTAIAGVRGTHFFIKVHHKDHVYVCTCNGRVHYQGHGHAEGEVAEAVQHKAFEFKRVDGKVVRTDGALLHHENHHVERTAKLIEKSIDWTKVH